MTVHSAYRICHIYLRQEGYVFVFVCLSVCLLAILRKNFRTDLHEVFRESWQWADKQTIGFWWRSGSPYGNRDCFLDSPLSEDTESGINRLRCATLLCRVCTRRHRHSHYDVTTSPVHDRQPRQTCLSGGMHCTSASIVLTAVYSDI